MKYLLIICAAFLFSCNNNNDDRPIEDCVTVIDSLCSQHQSTLYIVVTKPGFGGNVTVYTDTIECE